MPEVGRSSKGKSIANLVHMSEGEKLAALLRVQEFPTEEGQRFIVMGTRHGTIKKTDLSLFSNPRTAGIIAIQVDDDDRLIAVAETDGSKDLVIGSRNGMAIRFAEADARPMGRTARRRPRHPAPRGRRGRRDGGRHRRRDASDRLRERLRQADRGRGVPPPDARRASVSRTSRRAIATVSSSGSAVSRTATSCCS